MAKNKAISDPRHYMEMAIRVMKQSIQEPRSDKSSPKVGAVLVKQDGSVETAYRGELRHGDHAEFTLLERKNRAVKLDDCILFATLEPCAPGARKHPKLGCAERIVNARIKKVWVGVEDPDPTVDRKGIQYLIDNGVEVKMFDQDLQAQIWAENTEFKEQAEERAKVIKQAREEILLSDKEKVELQADLQDFSADEVNNFIAQAQLNVLFGSEQFNRIFSQLGLLEFRDGVFKPTGIGMLLFGTRPQLLYHNALIRATFKTEGRAEKLQTIEGPLVRQAEKIQRWYENHMGSQIDRTSAERKIKYDFPQVVFREAIVNAIVHRDYDVIGAPIYLEINDDAIIIKSPGRPVAPITMEQIQSLNSPSLSRNPKIVYVFDQLKLVEQRGLGFNTIKQLPERYNLPLPIINYDEPYMVITFPKSNESIRKIYGKPNLSSLSDDELAGYDWLRSKGDTSKREYAEHFEIDERKARRHLSKMKDLGLIKDNDKPKTSPNLRYIAL